jgi:hypothetical protein
VTAEDLAAAGLTSTDIMIAAFAIAFESMNQEEIEDCLDGSDTISFPSPAGSLVTLAGNSVFAEDPIMDTLLDWLSI